jgi:hypothetical protein
MLLHGWQGELARAGRLSLHNRHAALRRAALCCKAVRGIALHSYVVDGFQGEAQAVRAGRLEPAQWRAVLYCAVL